MPPTHAPPPTPTKPSVRLPRSVAAVHTDNVGCWHVARWLELKNTTPPSHARSPIWSAEADRPIDPGLRPQRTGGSLRIEVRRNYGRAARKPAAFGKIPKICLNIKVRASAAIRLTGAWRDVWVKTTCVTARLYHKCMVELVFWSARAGRWLGGAAQVARKRQGVASTVKQ